MAFPFAPEAAIGDPLVRVDTPALLLDLDAFEANVAQMARLANMHGLALRPHAKAHKSVAIARRQIAAGAVGICCQKLSEAWPFVEAGIADILISNEFVGGQKVAMAVELARRIRLTVCVDHEEQVEALGIAARAAGVRIGVLVEIDVGQARCGVGDEAAMLRLVERIGAFDGALHFAGLQAFHGGAQHLAGWSERRDAALRAGEVVARYRQVLDANGITYTTITGGGTGTAEFDAASGVYTELQPGSYVFNDGHYGRNEWQDGGGPRHSLFVAATVMSVKPPLRVVADVGLKGLAVDSGLPVVATLVSGADSVGLLVRRVNDEHCVIEAGDRPLPALGEKVLLIPGHCDPTVNLYRRFVGIRNGRVECLWDIEASGLSR